MVDNTQITLRDPTSGNIIVQTAADEIVSVEKSVGANQHQGPVDQPGTDDLLVTNVRTQSLDGGSENAEVNYVVRLNAAHDLHTFGGKKIQWTDETGTTYLGEIAGAIEEPPNPSFSLSISDDENAWQNQIQFGFPQGTSFVAAQEKEHPRTNFKNIKKRIAQGITLENGDSITIEDIRHLEQTLREQFKSKVADIIVRPKWFSDSGNQVSLDILVIPKTGELTPILPGIVDSKDSCSSCPSLKEKVRSCFGNGPYTAQALEEGIKKLQKAFYDDPEYYLDRVSAPQYRAGNNEQAVTELPITFIPITRSQPVIKTIQVNIDGTSGDQNEYIQGTNSHPAKLRGPHNNYPMNRETIEYNKQKLEKYYGDRDQVAQVGYVFVTNTQTIFQVQTYASPTSIQLVHPANLSTFPQPSQAELKKMFGDKITKTSIDAGMATLTSWYQKEGYHLSVEPNWTIAGNTLQILASPSVMTGEITFLVYEDGKLKNIDAGGNKKARRYLKSMTEFLGAVGENEKPLKEGDFINEKRLRQAVSRMEQELPFKSAHYEIQPSYTNNGGQLVPTGQANVVIIVETQTQLTVNIGGSAYTYRTLDDVQQWGGSVRGGADFHAIDGTRLGGSVDFRSEPSYAYLGAEGHASYIFPSGYRITGSPYGLIPTKGDLYPGLLGVRATIYHPILGPYSPLQLITEADFRGVFGEDFDNAGFWNHFSLGAQYLYPNTILEGTLGPSINYSRLESSPYKNDAQAYFHVDFSAAKRNPIVENRLNLDVYGKGGLHRGGVPEEERYSAANTLPNYTGYRDHRFEAFSGTRGDLLLTLPLPPNSPITIRQGVGAGFDSTLNREEEPDWAFGLGGQTVLETTIGLNLAVLYGARYLQNAEYQGWDPTFVLAAPIKF